MKFKKIIKGIMGVGVVGGIAYLAYKIGEYSGEMNERVHAMADIGDDDEDDFSYDEPDDGCIAPDEKDSGYDFKPLEPYNVYAECDTRPTKRDVLKKYSPFEDIYIAGVERGKLRVLLLNLAIHKRFDRSEVERYFDGDERVADEVLRMYEKAGYITKQGINRYRCLLTTEEYCRLVE